MSKAATMKMLWFDRWLDFWNLSVSHLIAKQLMELTLLDFIVH